MNHNYDKECSMIAMNAAMKWYGWGSPIGLSIFFMSLCICASIIYCTFFS